MNSRTFSCAVSALLSHSAGKMELLAEPVLMTWKSLKMTRPQSWFAGALTGVLTV